MKAKILYAVSLIDQAIELIQNDDKYKNEINELSATLEKIKKIDKPMPRYESDIWSIRFGQNI